MPGTAPINGPKYGHHVCDADDHTDKQGIWQLQDRHQDEAQHTDDRGIDKFSGYEAAEQPVAFREDLMAGRDVLLWEKCINDFPAAAHQTFLIIQHINRNDDRDQQVDDPVCDPHGDRINGRNHVCSEIAKRCDEVRDRIGDRFGDRFDVEIRELLLQALRSASAANCKRQG